MIEKAIITADASDNPPPHLRIAGVSLLQRAILTCRKANIPDIVVVADGPLHDLRAQVETHPRIREDARIAWINLADPEASAALRTDTAAGFLLVAPHGICDPAFLEAACRLDPDRLTAITTGATETMDADPWTGIAVCPGTILDDAHSPAHVRDALRRQIDRGEARTKPVTEGYWQRVDSGKASIRAAKNRLFASVTKPTSGFVSRTLNSRFSIPFSKLLVEWPVTPNNISLLTMLIGIIAAALLMIDAYWALCVSGLLWQLAAITDRSDGEIARVKHLESKAGAWFDTLTDQAAYIVYYACCLAGMTLRTGSLWYVYFGLVTLGILTLAVLAMMQYLRRKNIGSLQMYDRDFGRVARQQGGLMRFFGRMKFVTKRDFFSLLFMWICILDLFPGLYWTLTLGSLVTAGVIFMSHRLIMQTIPAVGDTP